MLLCNCFSCYIFHYHAYIQSKTMVLPCKKEAEHGPQHRHHTKPDITIGNPPPAIMEGGKADPPQSHRQPLENASPPRQCLRETAQGKCHLQPPRRCCHHPALTSPRICLAAILARIPIPIPNSEPLGPSPQKPHPQASVGSTATKCLTCSISYAHGRNGSSGA